MRDFDATVAELGDLDSHGFAILGRLRQHLEQTESVLMDADTLSRFHHLAVPEPIPHRGHIGYLTLSEHHALTLLRAGDLRLEQERIPWAFATERIQNTLRQPGD